MASNTDATRELPRHRGTHISADQEKLESSTHSGSDASFDHDEPVEAAAEAEAEPQGEKAVAAPPGGQPPGGPPPNGGTKAWLQVLGSWFLFFNTWGLLNTFGVYQTYYEGGQLFVANSSDISWIGTVQALMVLIVGAVVGPIYDRGYFRWLLVFGTFMVVFGHMMLSLCHTLWECILAQGFVIGIGAGALFVPAVAILPTYFSTRLGLAVGLAASGSSSGGIIYPIMFYKLLGEVGFGWAVRILGFTALATLIVPLLCMQMRVKPPKARALFDMTAFTDLPYMVLVLACAIGFIALYVGIFYFSYFGESTGITDASLSFYLIPILNAGSVFGRTVPNYLADKIGPLNVITPGAFLVGVILLCNLAVTGVAGIVITTLFFGFFSGIFIALPPVLFVVFTKDRTKIGTRIGMGFAMLGAGVLCGGPGGGGILDRRGTDASQLDWTSTWIYGGVTGLAAGCALLGLRIWRGGAKLMVKC
ncbi:Major Facilitator Superfamily [Teratosphaeria destructans]|uniref:Major Facilitator Superfamily n=1 Tax=Teratosphaeria destructans TaxID=418781 RepID=A0A9W7SYA2_9PEZI|nr:Major Facilitator Superfamily [Teratosphaeria destructans]